MNLDISASIVWLLQLLLLLLLLLPPPPSSFNKQYRQKEYRKHPDSLSPKKKASPKIRTKKERNSLLASYPQIVSMEHRERTRERLQISPSTHKFHDRETTSFRETQGKGECRQLNPAHSWRRRKSCRKRKKYQPSSACSLAHSRPIQSQFPPAQTADSESESPTHQIATRNKNSDLEFSDIPLLQHKRRRELPKDSKNPSNNQGIRAFQRSHIVHTQRFHYKVRIKGRSIGLVVTHSPQTHVQIIQKPADACSHKRPH